jgi:hypothetical protein
MDQSDKERILQTIIDQTNGAHHIVSASDIHRLLPKYSENDLRELLLDDEFYDELCRRIQSAKPGSSLNTV